MSRPSYYTPSEVAAHNSETDCWVSYLGKVYDLTQLCKEHSGWLVSRARRLLLGRRESGRRDYRLVT